MTQAPSKEMQDFVDSIRVPKGELAWVKGAVGPLLDGVAVTRVCIKKAISCA